ncbi:hypothetical protein DUNSADRAFT_3951 [Dunaliella salina]|uniref:Uncharacterized protein n=1 Tax=Dunaliella salina TaxID=3046 RepID=A0ABQ7H7U5_DUNSA|nr:hypothetical protein DUNSADRAFT_3951 [Dunaliella salina]|eukprot:KAF5842924.1 hypothetical protein DUNSADRAFT_3951 [Dunaliella salina]
MSLDDIAKLKKDSEQKGGPQGGRVQQVGRSAQQVGWGQPQAGRGQQQAGRGQQLAGRSQPRQHAPQQQAKTNTHPAYEKFHKVQKSQPGPKQHQFQHQQGPPAHTKVGGVVYKPVPTVPPAAHRGGRGKLGVLGSGRGGANGGRGVRGQTNNPRGYYQHHHQKQQLHPRGAFKPQQNNGQTRGRKGGTWSHGDLVAADKDPQHPLHHMLTKIVEAKLNQHTSSSSRERGTVAGEEEDLEALLGEEEEEEEVEGEGEEGEEEEEEEVEGSAGLGSQGGLHSSLGSSWNGAAGEGEDEDMEEDAEMPRALLDAEASRPPLRPAPGSFIASINAKRKKRGELPPPPLPSSGVWLPSRQEQNHHQQHLCDLPPHPPALSGGGGALKRHSSRYHLGMGWDDVGNAELAAYRHGVRLNYRSRHDYFDDLVVYDRMAGGNSRPPLPYSGYNEEDDYGRMRISRGTPRSRLSTSPAGRAPYSIGQDSYEPPRHTHSRSRSRSPLRPVRNSSMYGYLAEGLMHKSKGNTRELQQHDMHARSRLREREREREQDASLRVGGGRGDSRDGKSAGAPALRGAAASGEPAAAASGEPAAAAEGPDTGRGRGTLASYLLTETLFPDPGAPQHKVSSMRVARAAIAIEYIKSRETGKRAVLPLWQLQRLKENMESGQLPVVVPKPQGRLELTMLGEELVNAMCDKDPSLDVIKRGIDLIDTSKEWSFAAGMVAQQLDNDEDMSQILMDVPDFAALPGEDQNELLAAWYDKEWPAKWPDWSLKYLRREEWSSEEEDKEEDLHRR